MDEATRQAVELVLHRAQRWREQFKSGPDWKGDETFELVAGLELVLRVVERDGDKTIPQVELMLHRAARWRRQFVAQHGPGYEDDPTFRLVRDLDNALRATIKRDVE